MDQRYEPLFTPWKIGNVEMKNRIVMCPMGGTSLFGWMEPNHFDKVAAEFFLNIAHNYRFAVETVHAIKKACGKDYPVSLRYSVLSKTKGLCKGAVPGEEYTEVGRDMAESERAARYLQDAGYDMLNADNGTYDA